MTRNRNRNIKIHLGGRALLAVALYSAIMMAAGAALKSCGDNAKAATSVSTGKVR